MTDNQKAELTRLASEVLETEERYVAADTAAIEAHEACLAAEKLLAKAMLQADIDHIAMNGVAFVLNDEGDGVDIKHGKSITLP